MTTNLSTERLAKILAETQATINEHNRRQVRGSVEVDARLFEAVLIEAQLHRSGSNRLGIAAAANWVEQQRESYDNEHGRHDPDTGTFEFGNDAQSEYSATLAEIAEGIRALHPNAAPQPAVVPDGYALVPIEPTESMVIAGFEPEPDESFSEPDKWEAYEAMSGCQQAAHKAKLCWAAMIAAAPKLTNEP
jgi:hypothetical protein